MDASVPEIFFDASGECNYCKLHDKLVEDYPNDAAGEQRLAATIEQMKKAGKGADYDVVVGVSGGTDSTYLCHIAKQAGLRVLAVHLDCGWDSEIAVSNIKESLDRLSIDLYSYVVDWEEIKDLYRSVLKAGIPWPDGVTDTAILGSLYKVAARFGVKYIFVGNNFRTEGRQPDAWTDFDSRVMRSAHKMYGSKKLITFPDFTPFHLLYYAFFKKIRMIRPLYFIPFNKAKAKEFLKETYGWRDYGGHHHESIFTRYTIGVWLPERFGIDKRKVTFSAYVRSGEMSRVAALEELQHPAYDPRKMQEDREYVAKKLGFSTAEFEAIWEGPIRQHTDFPSYHPLYGTFKGLAVFLFKFILPWKPMMFYDPKSFAQQES
jgi:N-acetyl sugar amidotransferase